MPGWAIVLITVGAVLTVLLIVGSTVVWNESLVPNCGLVTSRRDCRQNPYQPTV